ncbi:MAG: TolC family protein [Bacteriovoracaceae bacterium]|nr:TolC family protein [Bacteriovoracaceae bacterium]
MIFLIMVFFTNLWASPHAISESKVVDSALKNFPVVLNAFQNVVQFENIYRKSYGEFDLKVIGESNSYLDGFYTGDAYKVYVEKELEFINAKLYSGVKKSNGAFPDYEGKLKASQAGEPFVGLNFSLLRNIFIDEDRLNILNSKIDLESSVIELSKVKLEVTFAATEAYWQFVNAKERYKIAHKNLDIAMERMTQLKRRISKGDLAEIYAVENEQYILKRKNQLLEELKNLVEKTYVLSLFYRDEEAKPIVLLEQEVSYENIEMKLYDQNQLDEMFQRVNNENPDLKLAGNKLLQVANEIKLAESNYWPELNLRVENISNRYISTGPQDENETRVLLNLEIPLEYNKIKGDYRAKKAKERIYNYELKFKGETLNAKARTISKKMEYTFEKYNNAESEIQLAQKLIQAEQKKFQLGDSDFFVLNIREQNWFEAQEKKLSAQLEFFILRAELRKLAAVEY